MKGITDSSGTETHHIASLDLTRASFADELSEARRDMVVLGSGKESPTQQFYSLAILHEEAGVMFKAYEHDFMSVLTHVYDCTDFSERKRGGTRIDLGAVQVNVLAAIQPAYLAELIPEIAWEQGFMSRVIMVYSGERIFKDLFAERSGTQLQDLTKRLSQIAQLYGEFTFTDEAVELLRTNHRTDWPPKPCLLYTSPSPRDS